MNARATDADDRWVATNRDKYVQRVARDGHTSHVAASALYIVFVIARIIALSGSAAVPVLALYEAKAVVTAIVGAAVFLSEVLIRVLSPAEISALAYDRGDQLLTELRKYQTRTPPYDSEPRFARFCEQIEEIRLHHQKQSRAVIRRTSDLPEATRAEVQCTDPSG